MTVELENQGNNKAPAYLTTPDFFARLQRDSATQLSIQNYKGTVVEVNSERVTVGSSGFTLLNTANLISATGTDSGGAPAINTLYYVYVSNSQASFAPLGIRMSATAPSLFGGVKYLAATGNGANWRFVGWVKTISNGGTVNFVKGQRQCFVVNYYNRIQFSLFYCPAYNVNAQATYAAPAGAAWIPFNGGDSIIEFISNGEDAFPYSMHVDAQMGSGSILRAGVGENGQDLTGTASECFFVENANLAQERKAFCVTESPLLPEGYTYLTMMGTDDAGDGITIIANPAKGSGASETAPCTYIRALVPA